MKNILDEIKTKAKALHKKIVLCEGEDKRVVKAAADATKEGIAEIVLLGNEAKIKAANPDVDLTGVTVVDPLTSPRLAEYNAKLCELRASKGMTPDQAAKLLTDGTYFGAMMLKMGEVDGLVSGACHSTANTLRPGLQIIKTAKGVSSVSSFNLMICPPQGNQYCPDGLVVFADCGLNPTYTSEGLADCAIATAKSAKEIAGIEPKVAMLSFSTKGSAKHERVDKVRAALEEIKTREPNLLVDGELQLDAAVEPEVARLKAPGSPVAGNANVFVFPSLEAGNIGYKIAQRFGGWTALGPLLQGFAHGWHDLSRGCSSDDIYKISVVGLGMNRGGQQ